VTGFGSAGFLALWEAVRSPDLAGSASGFQADREAEAGPADFRVRLYCRDWISTGNHSPIRCPSRTCSGVGAGPVLAATGYTIVDGAWATAGQPVKLKVMFLNKGAARSAAETVKMGKSGGGREIRPRNGSSFRGLQGSPQPCR
jgi:hypothetical protein